jgi:hypothetical protein
VRKSRAIIRHAVGDVMRVVVSGARWSATDATSVGQGPPYEFAAIP